MGYLPEPFFQRWGWAFGFCVGHWYLMVYLNYRHWAIDWHRQAPCCKFWLVLGPFELNRVWKDEEYPYGEDDDIAS